MAVLRVTRPLSKESIDGLKGSQTLERATLLTFKIVGVQIKSATTPSLACKDRPVHRVAKLVKPLIAVYFKTSFKIGQKLN